jgi:hypothetical protein
VISHAKHLGFRLIGSSRETLHTLRWACDDHFPTASGTLVSAVSWERYHEAVMRAQRDLAEARLMPKQLD